MATKFGELPLIKLQDPSITWSRDKLNTLYLHLHETNGYQTWEGGEELGPKRHMILHRNSNDLIKPILYVSGIKLLKFV